MEGGGASPAYIPQSPVLADLWLVSAKERHWQEMGPRRAEAKVLPFLSALSGFSSSGYVPSEIPAPSGQGS